MLGSGGDAVIMLGVMSCYVVVSCYMERSIWCNMIPFEALWGRKVLSEATWLQVDGSTPCVVLVYRAISDYESSYRRRG